MVTKTERLKVALNAVKELREEINTILNDCPVQHGYKSKITCTQKPDDCVRCWDDALNNAVEPDAGVPEVFDDSGLPMRGTA